MKNFVYRFRAFRRRNQQPLLCMLRELPPTIGTAELVTMELPVSFRRAPELLLKGMDAEGPDAVICLGLAANRKKISWRRWDSLRLCPDSDNDGMQPRTFL